MPWAPSQCNQRSALAGVFRALLDVGWEDGDELSDSLTDRVSRRTHRQNLVGRLAYGVTNFCSATLSGPGANWAGVAGPAVYEFASRSFGGGLVLLNDTRGDAPAVAHRDALGFRPRPDITAALTV